MLVRELISGLDIELADPRHESLRVCDITEDSRTVMPGSLFVARRGGKSDGRAFVPQALDAGAVAVLTDDWSLAAPGGAAVLRARDLALASAQVAERFYDDPSKKLTVIGVTGTNGKTTTTFLIHQMLNALGIRCGLMGTVCVDDGTEIAPATLTTPPALEVSRTLSRMVDAGCAAAVMEVSSHALHQHRVGAIRFLAGVFTNLSHDHLDYHGTMEEYAKAKRMLFERLPGAEEGGVAVVNIQDEAHSGMVVGCKARISRCVIETPLSTRTAGAGTAPETVYRARVRHARTSSVDLTIFGPWGERDVRLPLAGRFNIMNALEALAAVYELFGDHARAPSGSTPPTMRPPIDEILLSLEQAKAPPGRLEPMTRDSAPISVFVDYAHTDDALRTVLTTLRESVAGEAAPEAGAAARKLICVVGCGGDRDKSKRPKMGRVATDLADEVYFTSDNPRTEDARRIIDEMLGGVETGKHPKVTVEPDRERAIRAAIRGARAGKRKPGPTGSPETQLPGDVVLIAGKGHEDYQILPDPGKPGATITRHFDDREIAREALRDRGINPAPVVPLGCSAPEDAPMDLAQALLDMDPELEFGP